MLEKCIDADAIEKQLSEALRTVDLIGQLPLTEADRQKLTDSTKQLGAGEIPISFRLHSLACFLVFVGLRGYQQGNFWDAVDDALGITLSPHMRQEWGQAFEEVLRRYGLASFSGSEGLRYVTPILGHGGIPDYCLSDFFGKLLLPAVTGRLEYDGEVETLLDEWRARPALFLFADMPVRRFLLIGGRTARNFLTRCLRMADEALSGATGGAGELGLPPGVVEKFYAWVEQEPQSKKSRGREHGLRSPELRFEPGTSGLLLVMPAQCLPTARLQGNLPRLEVKQNGTHLDSVALRATRCNGEVETSGAELLLRKPFDTLEICLQAGAIRFRNWHFDGISAQEPWMAFDERTGRLIRERPIPKKSFWLLSHDSWGVSLDAADGAHIREEAECWIHHAARLVELDRPTDLVLRSREESARREMVPVDSETWNEPRLEGGYCITWPILRCPQAHETRVYAGESPQLVIPVSAADYGAWRACTLGWRSGLDGSQPEQKARLEDLVGDPTDTSIRLPLSHPGFLGPEAVGPYTLRLRGRLAQDAAFHLCLLPGMTIELPESELVADGNAGASEAQPRLCFPRPVKLWLGEDTTSNPLSPANPGGTEYRLRVTPDQSVVQLVLGIDAPNGGAQIPLELHVPRLQWAVSGVGGSTQLDYRCKVLEIALQQLEQADAPILVVKSPFSRPVEAELALVPGAQKRNQRLGSGRNEFRLAPFLDTIRGQSWATQVLKLHLRLGNQEETVTDLLRVRVDWIPEDVQVCAQVQDNRRRFLVRWQDGLALRNRLLRLWKLPEKSPLGEQEVPDGSNQTFFNAAHGALCDGLYRVEFSLRDEWSLPTAPDSFARNIQDFELSGVSVKLVDSQRRQFDDLLRAISDLELRGAEIIEAFFHPQMATTFLEHPDGARQFCAAVYERWTERPRDRTAEEWQRDCRSIVSQVFSRAGVEHIRLLEAMAEGAFREGEATGNDELAGFWLHVMIDQGALQQPWGTAFGELLKRNGARPSRWIDASAPPDTSLQVQDIYEAVTWSSTDITAVFLEKLRRTAKIVRCNGRQVTRVESRPSDNWPLVVHYRAKAQPGVPAGIRLSPTGRLYLGASVWHRVKPQKWTDRISSFVLARCQRALAWGASGCSEQCHNQIHDLGRWFCAKFGQDYLSELRDAEQDLRKWARASQREVRHES